MMGVGGTLELWEALEQTAPPARGAAVLVARGLAPDRTVALAMPLAVAARESLAELRARVGAELDAVVVCPACEALLDVPLPLDVLLADADVPRTADLVDDVEVRGPTTKDVLAALASPDPARTLRARCTRWPTGVEPAARPGLAARVAAAAERLSGAAGVTVRLDCPECEGDVLADVDVVGLLTERVAADAQAALADVAVLAAAFGWDERAILELSTARFEAYLGLARARV
ncbi:hypothetical protein ACNHYB_03170 [Isoptericola jiangsuensis]|uniref:hypothetical protein n=1 Tax=Isoptericola jiangsuensis TaxID=548579 RepID=UPI003AB0FBDC